ncbi:competence/damage-inducible domain protein CinA [Gleimia coleocanis DSM 15436]|uniref:Competence/damage-inducible domain protein CinA n=2 Tax=Gleimia TaxID=2692113 RepID=C0W0E5_9ACTO|nr:competence/damage-inducible domain protein CinA [Gleimia coleocanis DSM 15436]
MQTFEIATNVIHRLSCSPETVAVAESLTGGLVSAALVAVPGASQVMRGGVTTYATETKHSVLAVDLPRLKTYGPVDPEVAQQMAENVRELFDTDWGIATTGVAGPSEQDGHPVGEVYIAVANETDTVVKQLHLSGNRDEIRTQTVSETLKLLLEFISGDI